VTEKSLGIPAIRAWPNSFAIEKIMKTQQFSPILAASLCQADLFHIDEI
jgi:hypothetical protein